MPSWLSAISSKSQKLALGTLSSYSTLLIKSFIMLKVKRKFNRFDAFKISFILGFLEKNRDTVWEEQIDLLKRSGIMNCLFEIESGGPVPAPRGGSKVKITPVSSASIHFFNFIQSSNFSRLSNKKHQNKPKQLLAFSLENPLLL